MSGCACDIEIENDEQKKVLYWLMAINTVMFVLEMGLGWIAQSTALIADSLDMLADAIVYGIGLYAVGKAASDKTRAAFAVGYLQAALGTLVVFDVLRRIMVGSEPVSELMMGVGFVALIANAICMVLIFKHREGEVHMRASWVCSVNDVIANACVIFSGIMVWKLGSRWPDIIIGGIIAVVILRGSWIILRDSKRELITSET